MKTPAMSIAFGQMNVIPSIKFENGFIASRSVQADNDQAHLPRRPVSR